MHIEQRAMHGELRVAVAEDGTRSISGFIPYNSDSAEITTRSGKTFKERIAPGAFRNALSGGDVVALRDHDPKLLLGRTKSGTLALQDSPEGLRYTVKLPNTQAGNDLAESINRGDLDATSFGFNVAQDGDTWSKRNGETIRSLNNIDLFEVSPCSFPAYPGSSISIRSTAAEVPADIEAPQPESADPDTLRSTQQMQLDLRSRQ